MLPSISHMAGGKCTGSENRLHVSGSMDAGVTRGRSWDASGRRSSVIVPYPNLKQYAAVPDTWDGSGCRDATASAQHNLVRADYPRIRSPGSTSPCRSVEALDEEVIVVKLVIRRGSRRGGDSGTNSDILGIARDLICEMNRKGMSFATG
jgi:hypothetical protein